MAPDTAKLLVRALAPGQRLCWYRGYLPTDRLYPRKPEKDEPREIWALRWARERAVDRLAQTMLKLGAPHDFCYSVEQDRLTVQGAAMGVLSQRRLAPMFYEYFITRAGEA